MKNFFKKMKSYSFWASLSAAIIILINSLGNAFGFSIENQLVEDIIMSFAGVLVVIGLVSKSEKKKENESEEIVDDENKKEE